jgi:hypothetical protein
MIIPEDLNPLRSENGASAPRERFRAGEGRETGGKAPIKQKT